MEATIDYGHSTNAELLVSYGVLDCEMRLARFSLEHVLRDVGIES